MKVIQLFILLLITNQMFGQKPDSVLSLKNLPEGLTVQLELRNGDIDFPSDYSSIATFKFRNISISYYVFSYVSADSSDFRKAEDRYWMAAGCNFVANKHFEKNIRSFTKCKFYFLPQYCPCRTNEHEDCAELAKKLYQWSRTPEK